MKTRFTRSLAAGLRGTAVALALSSCGGGTEVLVVPLFVFGFDGSSGGVPVEVFILPDRPTTTSGSFDSVNMNVGDNAQLQFGGSWSGCSFTISLPAGQAEPPAPAASSYEGRLQGTDKLVLTPPASSGRPTLTLTRKPFGAVTGFGC